jgi:nucleoside-diphosphate-sugar epimerase
MLDLNEIENLAITGANGFVGRSITERLAQLEERRLPKRITLVTRSGLNFTIPKKLQSRVQLVMQDLTKKWDIPHEVSHLINLAADGSHQPYSKNACEQFTSINVNLILWLKESSNKVTVFHASSGACFGFKALNADINETNEKQLFIENRIKAENFLIENQLEIGFDLRIGRLFSFSGKNLLVKPQYAISHFVNSAVNNRKIEVFGNPDTQRSYLHESAMSAWILEGLVNPISYRDLQIGSSDIVTLQQIADFIAENTNSTVRYPSNPAVGDIYIPTNAETRIKLGVEEGLGWRDAVLEMISEAKVLRDGN